MQHVVGMLRPCPRLPHAHTHARAQVDVKKLLLYVHYAEEDSYEEINAAEVIRDGHIAVSEWRARAGRLGALACVGCTQQA